VVWFYNPFISSCIRILDRNCRKLEAGWIIQVLPKNLPRRLKLYGEMLQFRWPVHQRYIYNFPGICIIATKFVCFPIISLRLWFSFMVSEWSISVINFNGYCRKHMPVAMGSKFQIVPLISWRICKDCLMQIIFQLRYL